MKPFVYKERGVWWVVIGGHSHGNVPTWEQAIRYALGINGKSAVFDPKAIWWFGDWKKYLPPLECVGRVE